MTNDQIRDQLDSIVAVTVEWTGRLPRDAEDWDTPANDKLATVTIDDVRAMLDRHNLLGDDDAGTIDQAISIACEPDGLPDNAMVTLYRAADLAAEYVRTPKGQAALDQAGGGDAAATTRAAMLGTSYRPRD